MNGSRITAMGHHQPEHVLTNDELARTVDTSDDWIRRRTGIATRRIARTESVTDLAAAAAGRHSRPLGSTPGTSASSRSPPVRPSTAAPASPRRSPAGSASRPPRPST